MTTLGVVAIGYLLGSIPFAFLLTRRWSQLDIRQAGSGNVGATNVLRTAGVAAAVTVMLLDVAKGAGSVMVAERLSAGSAAPAAAGLAAIVGHIYPVWLRFHGGKGVAVAAGVFCVLSPIATAIAASLFLVTVWLTRYISLGSIAATIALPPAAWLSGEPRGVVAAAAGSGALILFRHRANFRRLRAGTERKMGARA
jgi:glycerol-3-phosphate acyltransferase PlsY